MQFRNRLLLAACVFFALPASTRGVTITSFTNTTGAQAIEFPMFAGQSVTTLNNGPWNNLSFNFFGVGALTPHAAGTLYLLSQVYTGTPSGLNSAVPGYLASSVNIIADQWRFNPSVTLQPNTQYFLFADTAVLVSGNGGLYAGGVFYNANNASTAFLPIQADGYFTLNGTQIPEPKPALALAAGLLAIVALHYSRRAH
jgi:hypothetical protein